MLNYKFYKVFVLNKYNIIKLKQFYKSKTIFIKKFFKDKIYKNTNNSYKTYDIVVILTDFKHLNSNEKICLVVIIKFFDTIKKNKYY